MSKSRIQLYFLLVIFLIIFQFSYPIIYVKSDGTTKQIDYTYSFDVIINEQKNCQYQNYSITIPSILSLESYSSIPTWSWTGTTQYFGDNEIYENGSISLNEELYIEILNQLDSLTYYSIFDCIDLSLIISKLPHLLLLLPDSDLVFDNFARSPSIYFELLGIHDNFFTFPLNFDRYQEMSSDWVEINPGINESQSTENIIPPHTESSFNYLRIDGEFEKEVRINDSLVDFNISTSNLIQFKYTNGLLQEFYLQNKVIGYRGGEQIDISILITILNDNYSSEFPELRDYPIIEDIRYFYSTNKILILIILIPLIAIISYKKFIRFKSKNKDL